MSTLRARRDGIRFDRDGSPCRGRSTVLAVARRLLVATIALLCPTLCFGANWQGAPGRQVVVFGVLAKPNSSEMDPKIAPVVQAQLRRLLPNHGFQIVNKIKSERLVVNKAIKCDLADGFAATAKLTNPLDSNGKVQIRFELMQGEISQFQTAVATPPDQFNFFDKSLPDGNHLLVGVGAR